MDYPDIKVDGDIGPETLQSLQAYLLFRRGEGVNVLLKALNCLQGAFYIELAEKREKDEAFVYGWIRTRIVIV
jgi:lysozyme family protein